MLVITECDGVMGEEKNPPTSAAAVWEDKSPGVSKEPVETWDIFYVTEVAN